MLLNLQQNNSSTFKIKWKKMALRIEEIGEGKEDVSSALIKEMSSKWIDLQIYAKNITQTHRSKIEQWTYSMTMWWLIL